MTDFVDTQKRTAAMRLNDVRIFALREAAIAQENCETLVERGAASGLGYNIGLKTAYERIIALLDEMAND